jgi:ribosomal protein S27E
MSLSRSQIQTDPNVDIVGEESESRCDSIEISANRLKKRSVVWNHFREEGENKVVCNHCGKVLCSSRTPGTSNLKRHLVARCDRISQEDKQMIMTSRDDPFDSSTFKYDAELTRSLLTLLFIDVEVPFSLIYSRFWEPAMRSMRPEYKAVGRQTMRDDCVGVFRAGSDVVKIELEDLDSRVSLTSDIWTSSINLAYLCLTSHYIDKNFKFRKRIIGFRKISYPHTDQAVASTIEKILNDWKLDGIFFTITLDNCSVNDSAVMELEKRLLGKTIFDGKHMHMRCAAHILNLMVQDGTSTIQPAVKSIRELMRNIVSSGSRLQTLNRSLSELNLQPKRGLTLDYPTR